MIINELSNRSWLLAKGAEFPVFRNSLSTMYAHISFNNREFSKIYIDYIF